jgi:hypothetical protein
MCFDSDDRYVATVESSRAAAHSFSDEAVARLYEIGRRKPGTVELFSLPFSVGCDLLR